MGRLFTTLVGSFPRPGWLGDRPSDEALRDATSAYLAYQQRMGIDILTDGEFRRFNPDHPETNGMIEHFVLPMEGITAKMTLEEILAYRELPGMKFRTRPPGMVIAPIRSGTLNLPDECSTSQNLALGPFKFTATGPHMLAKTLYNRFYQSYQEVAEALADVLAYQVSHMQPDVLQLDEANLPGHFEEWSWAAATINRVLDASTAPTKCVHLCFGNYGGQTIQAGRWNTLVDYLNALHCDQILLEFAHRDPEELAVINELRPDLKLVLGIIDVKINHIEERGAIALKLDKAFTLLGPDRIVGIAPDCGFWMLQRSVAERKIKALVEGRNLFEGKA